VDAVNKVLLKLETHYLQIIHFKIAAKHTKIHHKKVRYRLVTPLSDNLNRKNTQSHREQVKQKNIKQTKNHLPL
jgi:hypothetical protein